MSTDFFYMSQEDEEADSNPVIVMLGESTGEKYARCIGSKATEHTSWLVQDITEEL